MSAKEGHVLPRFDDRWSFLYLEQGRLEQDAASLAFVGVGGVARIPLNQIGLLLLGPGAVVTHAAMKSLMDNRSLIAWTGAGGIKLYAFGSGGNRSARRLLRQADLFCDRERRLAVVRRMYQKRFSEPIATTTTIEQIRGMEGARVRAAYQETARRYMIPWEGRRYDQDDWDHADPVNRALSAANALLYGLCHVAIRAAGYSPAIGFIHTGKMLSFVYDVADLYKTETTIPIAFEAAQRGGGDIEKRTRGLCREVFYEKKIMEHVLPDIAEVLDAGDDLGEDADEFAGRIVTLADRAQVGRLPWEREFEGEGRAVGSGGP